MRIWIDLTNSPHVLVMRPVIERLQADGHDVRVTARDFAQTIELCERLCIAHTAIGHHRGERLAAKFGGLASRSSALVRWALAETRAPRRGSVRHRSRTRLQRRVGRGRDAADSVIDDVRLRVGLSPAPRQLPPRARGCCARLRSHPSACKPYGAAGKIRAYEGLKEEYYLADFDPDPAVLAELALDSAAPDRGDPHAA